MLKLTEAISQRLEEMKMKYNIEERESNGDVIRLYTRGNKMPLVRIDTFINTENIVQIICFEVITFSQENNLVMLQVSNKLNSEYRYAKFWISLDGCLTASIDVFSEQDTSAELVLDRIATILRILDDIYPKIIKVIYD